MGDFNCCCGCYDTSKLRIAWENYYKPKRLGYMKLLKLVTKKVNQRKAPNGMDVNKLVKHLCNLK